VPTPPWQTRAAVDAVGGPFVLEPAPLFLALAVSPIADIVVLKRRWRDAQPQERRMPLFIVSINWTDQGIRAVKDAPKRSEAAKALAKKVGIDIKQIYLTSGDSDLVAIIDSPSGDNVAKFAMAIGSQGNIRTKTARAWTEAEFTKLISELP
jgi:uncharacterized protein with GYD domain